MRIVRRPGDLGVIQPSQDEITNADVDSQPEQKEKPTPKWVDITRSFDEAYLPQLLPKLDAGDVVVYHKGLYAAGVHKAAARAAYEKGYVVLIQRRLGPKNFAYTAIRTRKRIKS
jgi:hypothetical protein